MSKRYAYKTLPQDEDEVDFSVDEDFTEEQFIVRTPKKVPWKAISLACFLCFGGIITLVTSILIVVGHLDNDVYADRMWPLMILGVLMFIPGAYHVRIAWLSFMQKPGYSFDDIPDVD